MGHDISAYIKTKSTPKDSFENEIAYFRIGAFNTSRQRLFYGILPNATSANAGVSGNGSTLDFTEDEIKQAILQAFSLGWEVGARQAGNNPISLEALRDLCAFEFAERDRLIQLFAQIEKPE